MSNIEKIRQEIERRKKEHMYDEMPITIGRYYEDRDLLAFIDSLQQEQQEEDLEKEIKNYLATKCAGDDEPSVSEIARHFYELGLNARKEE